MPLSARLLLAALALPPSLAGAAPRAQDTIGEFPHVQAPAGNPLTPAKVLLGQALFFEEQLSSDDTMACATCHRPEAGGSDPRPGGRAPGEDGVLGTLDDECGSFGVRQRDAQGRALPHALFGLERQVSARHAPTVIGAAFFNAQFWDTRALPVFRDLAGEIVLEDHASLESQAVGPLISSVEMGHVGRTWDELTAKLARAKPLALARELPAALREFVGSHGDYGPLFQAAFGTDTITRERIAFALASYERTLVPDQSPFDLGTMSARQQEGFRLFKKHGACNLCHTAENGLFSDGARRTISLPGHPRATKTPTLRNVGLRPRFMSSGQFISLDEVVEHYVGLEFIHFESPDERTALLDFVANALTDPRVAQRLPPFDGPRLKSEPPADEPAKGAGPAAGGR